MKQRTFIVRDDEVIRTLVAFLETWPKDPPFEVIVRPHKINRSLLQNSLYWKWATVIANEFGMTKEEIHEDLKRRLLVPIYERDDVQYAEMIHSLRKLYQQGFKQESQKLHAHVVRLTSTTNASVKQFAEYLTEIEKDMAGRGISLPHPGDLYEQAIK